MIMPPRLRPRRSPLRGKALSNRQLPVQGTGGTLEYLHNPFCHRFPGVTTRARQRPEAPALHAMAMSLSI
jgi:hypothetical protein